MLNMKVWIVTLTSWMGVSFTTCVLGGVVVPGSLFLTRLWRCSSRDSGGFLWAASLWA